MTYAFIPFSLVLCIFRMLLGGIANVREYIHMKICIWFRVLPVALYILEGADPKLFTYYPEKYCLSKADKRGK